MNLHSKRMWRKKKNSILIYFVSSRLLEDLCLFEHKDCLASESSTSVARFVRSLTPLTGIKLERDTTEFENDSAFREARSLHLITLLFHHPKCNFAMCVSSVNLTSNPQWFVHINMIFFRFLFCGQSCYVPFRLSFFDPFSGYFLSQTYCKVYVL